MAKPDPTQEPEFKRVLGNLLKSKPRPHSEMKIGAKKSARPKRQSKKNAKKV
jgi:hypothetical protein